VSYTFGVIFLRQYRFVLAFLAVLVFSCGMVLHQFSKRQSKHEEMREAFIILHMRGYTNQANVLYQHLLMDIYKQPDNMLIDDFQRTMQVVEVGSHQPENLIWKYHWTVSNELEKRSERTLVKALKLADQLK
jgi:hypothetical protein